MVEYVEAVVEEVVKENVVLAESAKTTVGGRPSKADVSQKKVSEKTGIPKAHRIPGPQGWGSSAEQRDSAANPEPDRKV